MPRISDLSYRRAAGARARAAVWRKLHSAKIDDGINASSNKRGVINDRVIKQCLLPCAINTCDDARVRETRGGEEVLSRLKLSANADISGNLCRSSKYYWNNNKIHIGLILWNPTDLKLCIILCIVLMLYGNLMQHRNKLNILTLKVF